MLTWMKQWLEPPHFDGDEEKTRQAWLLNMLSLYFAFGLVLAAVIFVPFFAKQKVAVGAIIFALWVLNALCRYLMFRRRIELACTLMVISIWVLFQGLAIFSGGITSPILFTVAATTIIIGLLFKWRTGNVLVFVSILAGLGMAVLQENDFALPMFFFLTPLTRWFWFAMALVFMHSTMNLNVRNLEHALALARQENAARRQAEQSLRESEELFRAAFENTLVGMVFTSLTGQLLRVNDAFCQMLGYSQTELQQVEFGTLTHPDDRALSYEYLQRLLRGEQRTCRFEKRYVHKNGKFVWVDIGVSIVHDAYGNPLHFVTYTQDITVRKRAEEQLVKLNECLLNFGTDPLENINRLTAVGGELLEADCALYNRLDQGMLCSWGQWHTPPGYNPQDDPEGHICYDVIKLGSEKPFIVRHLSATPYARSDPNVVPYQLQTYVGQVVKFDNQFVGSLCMVYQRDYAPTEDQQRLIGIIASAIGVEEKRRQAEQALAESEKKYRELFQVNKDGIAIYLLNPHGPPSTFVELNDAAAKMLGYTREEMLKLTPPMLEPHTTEGQLRLRRSEFESKGVMSFETVLLHKNGHPVSTEFTAQLIQYEGKPAIMNIVRDITARKQMEEALRKSEERYALAAQGANDGLWDWDLSMNEIYYSPRWKSMLGYAEEQIVNSPDAWFGLVHPEDVVRVKEEISSHLRGTVLFLQSEHRMRHANGSYLWILARALAIRDGNGIARRMVGSLSDITARKHAEEQLIHDAFHDALTALPNRSLFIDRLDRAIERTHRRAEYKFAILYLDLDRFKSINDSLGHTMGDQLLVVVTRRLQCCVRALDTVARLGGDEFVILLDDIEEAHDAMSAAERIQNQLAQPFEVDGHRMFISASVGIVLNSAEYASPGEILRDADIAMYHAKSLGRARYAVFDTRMRNQAFARAEIETDLRGAVERQEFRVYYQPIVSLEDGCFVGLEALIRWQHPKRGLLAPAEFIGVAEETGLIIPIGKWVIREACRQMRDWQMRFAYERPMSVHVNLSAKQVCHPNLTREIKQALQETGLAPGSLSLEITESVLMENSRVAVAVLKELQAWGVRVELDDFGTGYSSLNYLHQFPITVLKVDRSFVNKMKDSDNNPGIVQAIIKLGHDLGMEVVAEGLETQSQLQQLKELECDYGQGYYFAKPLEVEAIEDLMKESQQQKSLRADHLG